VIRPRGGPVVTPMVVRWPGRQGFLQLKELPGWTVVD